MLCYHLQMAFADPEVEALYLLTDGKPDSSTSLVLREVARMNSDRNVRINTISFNCDDQSVSLSMFFLLHVLCFFAIMAGLYYA